MKKLLILFVLLVSLTTSCKKSTQRHKIDVEKIALTSSGSFAVQYINLNTRKFYSKTYGGSNVCSTDETFSYIYNCQLYLCDADKDKLTLPTH